MSWLITGGCGFLGTRLIKKLLDEGISNIRILDSLEVGSRNDLSLVTDYTEPTNIKTSPIGVELVVGDVRDAQLASDVCFGCTTVAHLAANTGVDQSVRDPRTDCLVNVVGTLNCLEAARSNGATRFVFASSGAPVGEVEPPIHEEVAPHPVSPYGASKLAGEGYCSAYFRTYGLETVALRFGNVYGPGSIHKGSVVAKFISRALRGLPMEIFGDGGQTRDFIYIDDLVDAVMLAASRPEIGGETFQIASGFETTVTELADKLAKALRKGGIDASLSNSSPRLGDVRRNFADTRKAQTRLGWKSTMSLDDGLDTTVRYFIEKGLS
jgi:UDP-glucose 4-epimerase